MSLATRCTACGTVFRVVQDQLKISEGWVRCGRCKEVFNALEGLFDLDREAPPPWPPAGSAMPGPGNEVDVSLPVAEPAPPVDASEPAAPAAPAEAEPPATVVAPEHAAAAPVEAEAFEPPAPPERAHEPSLASEQAQADELSAPPPADRLETEHVVEDAVSRFGPHHEPAPESTAMSGYELDIDIDAIADASSSLASEPEAAHAPTFVREAERRARWQAPRMRAVLAAASLVLAALLALQVGYHMRDSIVAQWPGARSLLQPMCEWLDCTLGPLRRIEDIAVESSSLTRASEPGVDALRLSVVLRNRSALPLAMPMIDLSLTDGNGELVARRALAASDFDRASSTLGPSAEANLQLAFSTGGRRVAGYTVEIFYP